MLIFGHPVCFCEGRIAQFPSSRVPMFYRAQRQQGRALRRGYAGQSRDIDALVPAITPKGPETGAATRLPQPHGPVIATAGQQLPIRAERYTPDRAGVPFEAS
jgi:hypothetical protein